MTDLVLQQLYSQQGELNYYTNSSVILKGIPTGPIKWSLSHYEKICSSEEIIIHPQGLLWQM